MAQVAGIRSDEIYVIYHLLICWKKDAVVLLVILQKAGNFSLRKISYTPKIKLHANITATYSTKPGNSLYTFTGPGLLVPEEWFY